MRHRPCSSVVVAALAGAALACVASVATTSAAEAAQIEQPASARFLVALDRALHPLPFTVAASGFTPGQQVFVEQCDGVSPSAANWDPAIDCDSGSSPAPVAASADGRAVFGAADLNHRFLPFVGVSPQSQFSCVAQGAGAPNGAGAVPAFGTCSVRVSSTNAAATSDQVLFAITLPAGAIPPPTTTPPDAGSPTTGPRGATTSISAKGGAATRDARSAHTTSSTRRAVSTPSSLVVGAQSAGRGGDPPASSSSTRAVGRLIGGIVIASGIGGYLWALRRNRAVAPRGLT